MRHSCGAILYAFDPKGQLGIILGLEGYHWLPFKGGPEKNETFEEAAIREIYEETCKIVKLDYINLKHNFKSKHKSYHIGLVKVNYNIIENFKKKRKRENKNIYKEKKEIAFFPLNIVRTHTAVHNITLASINYYWDQLIKINDKYQQSGTTILQENNDKYKYTRKQGLYPNYASKLNSSYIEMNYDKKRSDNKSWRKPLIN